ncbi:hypothetical protein C8F04DRAFT_1174734 [Mycena alexandri]|uniref:Uncharacterized protein n=1 Tax=Mycena alexandri TaxID=1745969 RepID=A0AAD6TEP5_9AGAR|nr:hypothetical protein C8F04DRAFT_1174734 [Mycena alexandri]
MIDSMIRLIDGHGHVTHVQTAFAPLSLALHRAASHLKEGSTVHTVFARHICLVISRTRRWLLRLDLNAKLFVSLEKVSSDDEIEFKLNDPSPNSSFHRSLENTNLLKNQNYVGTKYGLGGGACGAGYRDERKRGTVQAQRRVRVCADSYHECSTCTRSASAGAGASVRRVRETGPGGGWGESGNEQLDSMSLKLELGHLETTLGMQATLRAVEERRGLRVILRRKPKFQGHAQFRRFVLHRSRNEVVRQSECSQTGKCNDTHLGTSLPAPESRLDGEQAKRRSGLSASTIHREDSSCKLVRRVNQTVLRRVEGKAIQSSHVEEDAGGVQLAMAVIRCNVRGDCVLG